MVIEYSDLPDDVAAAAQRGRLAGDLGRQHRRPRLRRGVFGADGRRRPSALPFHAAYKKVAYLDAGRPAGRAAEAQRGEVRAVHLRPDALGRRGDRGRGRSGAGLRPAEERLRGERRHAGDGPGADGRRCTAAGSARRAWKWPTAWRSRSARFSPWTRRSWPAESARGRG